MQTVIVLLIFFYPFQPLANVECDSSVREGIKVKVDNLFRNNSFGDIQNTIANLVNGLPVPCKAYAYRRFTQLCVENFKAHPEKYLVPGLLCINKALEYGGGDFPKGRASSFYLKGILEEESANYYKSIDSFEKALEIAEGYPYPHAILRLIIIHRKLGEIAKAHECVALSLRDTLSLREGKYKAYEGKTYLELGNLLELEGRYEESLDALEKAAQYITRGSKDEYALYTSLGDTYDRLGSADSSKYSTAIDFYEKALTLSDPNKAAVYNNIGITYRKIKKFPDAEYHFNEAIRISRNVGDSEWLAKTYDNYGDLKKAQAQFDSALFYYQEAVKYMLFDPGSYNSSNLHLNPQKRQLKECLLKKDLLVHLADKANCWKAYYQYSNDKDHLEEALKTFKTADALIDLMRREYSRIESKLFWRERVKPIYENALESCYLLKEEGIDKKEDFFHFLEKSKSILLLDKLQTNRLESGFPEADKKAIDSLRDEILIKKAELDSSTSLTLISQIRRLEDSLSSLVERNISKTIMQGEIINLESFRNEYLNKETICIHFFYGERYIYVNSIDSYGNSKIERINLDNIEQIIEDFLTCLQDGNPGSIQSFERYSNLASTLYDSLYYNSIDDRKRNFKTVIIIPDGRISFVPFEALITNAQPNPELKEAQFLIYEKSIRYAFSGSVLHAQKELFGRTREKIKLLGVFPDGTLPIKEIDEMIDSLRSLSNIQFEPLVGPIKVSDFKDKCQSQQWDVIFIFSHAEAKGLVPRICFSGDTLFLREVFNLDLAGSPSVILAACQSGMGEEETGEGIYSLATAFSYSGAPNLISSVWNANQYIALKIFKYYFSYLNSGVGSSQSLHRAKLDYLQEMNEQNYMATHPSFWSNLFFMGFDDLSFNHEPTNTSFYMPILLLVLFIFMIFIIIKKFS